MRFKIYTHYIIFRRLNASPKNAVIKTDKMALESAESTKQDSNTVEYN